MDRVRLSRTRRKSDFASSLCCPLVGLLLLPSVALSSLLLLLSRTEALSSHSKPYTPSPSLSPSPLSSYPRLSLVTTIAEDVWRAAASDHHRKISDLLGPGLVDLDHESMRPVRKHFRARSENNNDDDNGGDDTIDVVSKQMTMLDPKHPIYNFLVEYYGLKGLKGPKRLARWSPGIGLFFWEGNIGNTNTNIGNTNIGNTDNTNSHGDPDPDSVSDSYSVTMARRIESLDDYHEASSVVLDSDTIQKNNNNNLSGRDETNRRIFLEGATPDDFALTLYLQGAEWIESTNDDPIYNGMEGILYRPIRHYDLCSEGDSIDSDSDGDGDGKDSPESTNTDIDIAHRKANSFLWYRSILEKTLANEAVLHCYGLHEWAMQYHPNGAQPPPSGKYQAHLPLRVSRETINTTVERKGLRCTHVDALRFFAPSAGPLNHHGASLERNQQLDLEQPGCVHAHMDLLKIALRIKPYCDVSLLVDILKVALKARTLDVGASPYDCSAYKYGVANAKKQREEKSIPVVPVETAEGRALYKSLQSKLMVEAEVVRKRLLQNYEAFGALAFSNDQLHKAKEDPSDEQFAKTEPGGKVWRRNLIDRSK